MIVRRGALLLLAGSSTFLLAGCGLLFPSDTLRQKIIVEVQTPAGVRTGSSVVETEIRTGKSWGDASGTRYSLRGEAVAVDLPDGRTLFALLSPANADQGDPAVFQTRMIERALRAGAAANPRIEVSGKEPMALRAEAKATSLQLELPLKQYPFLVAFRDIRDAKSVERVDPANLAATFGPGYALRRITVQVTDDPVTTGIEQRLPKPPFVRAYKYQGEKSTALNLYRGKIVSESIDIEAFKEGRR